MENPDDMTRVREKRGWTILFGLAAVLLVQLLTSCAQTNRQSELLGDLAIHRTVNTPGSETIRLPDLTPTPFMPIPDLELAEPPLAPTASVAETIPSPQAPPGFYGIDFTDQKKWVSIQIQPPDNSVNHGKAIFISFIPGKRCIFGDHHGCINTFTTQEKGAITFITIHSGVGGEGQRLRNALEGTGINRAAFSLRRVQANLKDLLGAHVAIAQGERVVGGLKLVAVTRIPASLLATYFNTPLDQVFTLAVSVDPALLEGINPAQPQLVFETCGWKMPGEPWAAGVTSTTGSIYLGVIQKDP